MHGIEQLPEKAGCRTRKEEVQAAEELCRKEEERRTHVSTAESSKAIPAFHSVGLHVELVVLYNALKETAAAARWPPPGPRPSASAPAPPSAPSHPVGAPRIAIS